MSQTQQPTAPGFNNQELPSTSQARAAPSEHLRHKTTAASHSLEFAASSHKQTSSRLDSEFDSGGLDAASGSVRSSPKPPVSALSVENVRRATASSRVRARHDGEASERSAGAASRRSTASTGTKRESRGAAAWAGASSLKGSTTPRSGGSSTATRSNASTRRKCGAAALSNHTCALFKWPCFYL